MKGILKIVLSCLVIIFLSGCSESPVEVEPEEEIVVEEEEVLEEVQEDKTLIVVFSRAGENYGVGLVEKGNTLIVAEIIAEETGYDLVQLETVNEYPISYDETLEVATKERQENQRPELKTVIEDFDSYTNIILGYPIWWGDMPMAIYTFLESYDFQGKTVYPFCTHGGSGLASTESSLKEALPNTEVKDGLAIVGTTAQENKEDIIESIQTWLSNNQLISND